MACATFTTPFGGCGVGVIVGVSLGVGVLVAVDDTVGVSVTVGVGVTVGITVTVDVAVSVDGTIAVGNAVLVLDGMAASASVCGFTESPITEQPARNMPAASRIFETERRNVVSRIFSFCQELPCAFH